MSRYRTPDVEEVAELYLQDVAHLWDFDLGVCKKCGDSLTEDNEADYCAGAKFKRGDLSIIARALGVTPQAVNNWIRKDEQPSEEYRLNYVKLMRAVLARRGSRRERREGPTTGTPLRHQ